jgi:Mn2+/Fe2+ NRAMP family transporter
MDTLLGIVVIYSWVHSLLILLRKEPVKKTQYETIVLIFGVVFIVLFLVEVMTS